MARIRAKGQGYWEGEGEGGIYTKNLCNCPFFYIPYQRPDRVTRGMSYWNYISHTNPKSKSLVGPSCPMSLHFLFFSFLSLNTPLPLPLASTQILVALYSHQGQGGGVKSSRVESTRLYSGPGARQGYARSGYTCTHTRIPIHAHLYAHHYRQTDLQ